MTEPDTLRPPPPRRWLFLPCDYRLDAQLLTDAEAEGFSLEHASLGPGGWNVLNGEINNVPGYLLPVRR
jgi:hypothetical protein